MGRGPIDTLVPEIWGETPDAPFLAPFCAAGSADFIREIWPRVGGIPQGFRQPMFDTFVTAIAEEIIRRRAPRLLYVHICQLDNAKHYFGLGSAQTHAALSNTDHLLGRLLKALEETGVLAQTDIVLCADHGQRPVTRVSFPNRFLRAQGLLTPAEGGVSDWRAQVHSSCLSGFLYENGARAVHMRSACPPIMYGCKYLNFSSSKNEMELIARRVIDELEGEKGLDHAEEYSDFRTERGKALRKAICDKLQFDSLDFQSLDGIIEAIGIEPCKLCTYCWNGKE